MSSDLKKINKLKKNSRRNANVQEPKLVERLIKISRVSKVTKGGKKLSFRAIVVVGDENGKVGVGVAKADDKYGPRSKTIFVIFFLKLNSTMKFSKRTLLKLKNKNKKLKSNQYKKLKRETLRGTVKGTIERPRLSVYRSNQHIYAQIIDDTNSRTLLACSTLDRYLLGFNFLFLFFNFNKVLFDSFIVLIFKFLKL